MEKLMSTLFKIIGALAITFAAFYAYEKHAAEVESKRMEVHLNCIHEVHNWVHEHPNEMPNVVNDSHGWDREYFWRVKYCVVQHGVEYKPSSGAILSGNGD
jgi:hypothetical protein